MLYFFKYNIYSSVTIFKPLNYWEHVAVAVNWTGAGMSINRVIEGSTKKQPNKQGHKRVDCLKIEKKTQMGDILNQATRAHNNRHIQQRPIEKNQEQTRTNH